MKRDDSLDDSCLLTGHEPNAYDLKETYVESYTESLTHPQFSEQGFLEDVEYDDTALEDVLREAHRVHVYHFQREGLSVGQSSSSMSERKERLVGERTVRPVESICQEQEIRRKDSSAVLMIQEQLFISELSKDIQDAILLILHYRTMLLFRTTSSSIFTILDVRSICIISYTLD